MISRHDKKQGLWRAGVGAFLLMVLCSSTAQAQVSRTIGTLPPGGTITITFDVAINTNFPAGVFAVSNQGTVVRSFSTHLTDDPAVGGESDPTVMQLLPDYDFGDAPSPYPTLIVSNGARHIVPFTGGATLYLGAVAPDVETNGQPQAGALGDNLAGVNDEDGVTLPPMFYVLQSNALTVTASGAGQLDAWIDWNRDGDWDDAGENLFSNRSVATGPNLLSFGVPAFASSGTSFARFRLSSAGGLANTGIAADGEVEDYLVNLDATRADLAIFNTGSPDPLISSSNLTYTLTVTNIGIHPASSVTVTNVLPAGATFVSASPGWTQHAGVVYGGPFALPSGSATSFVIQIAVSGASATTLTNRAYVSGGTATDTNLLNNSAIAAATLADTDGDGRPNFADSDNDNDGIPDVWEIQYGANPTNGANALLDADLDGYTAFQEYLADTSPTNETSYPRIAACASLTGVAITFPSSTARLYRLDYSTNLLNSFWMPFASNIAGLAGSTTLIDTNPTSRRSFRISVGLP